MHLAPVKELHHFLNGKAAPGMSGRFGDVFNPATGEIQAKVALASGTEVRKAVENALAAFPAWARSTRSAALASCSSSSASVAHSLTPARPGTPLAFEMSGLVWAAGECLGRSRLVGWGTRIRT